MAIQLTPEQEERVRTVVDSGAYSSPMAVLDAALSAVEAAATPGFEGSEHELEQLLEEGLASGELSEQEFWESVDEETDDMLRSRRTGAKG